jgi:hypothetical protein
LVGRFAAGFLVALFGAAFFLAPVFFVAVFLAAAFFFGAAFFFAGFDFAAVLGTLAGAGLLAAVVPTVFAGAVVFVDFPGAGVPPDESDTPAGIVVTADGPSANNRRCTFRMFCRS